VADRAAFDQRGRPLAALALSGGQLTRRLEFGSGLWDEEADLRYGHPARGQLPAGRPKPLCSNPLELPAALSQENLCDKGRAPRTMAAPAITVTEESSPMMDPIRRNMLATGAAAAAAAAAPRVFAQQTQGGVTTSFCEKGDVPIRYQEIGSGFPLLVTPGGRLNSRISNWQAAVINAMAEFKSDFRCITMDQRNATGGESTGPVPVDDPWGAFADDQLGLIDHLGMRQFFFMGYCIGGPF
jgi:hypothetical protein